MPDFNFKPGTDTPPPLWQRLLVGRHPRRTLLRAALVAATAFVVFKWVLLPIRIQGFSMEPACRDGAVALINRLAYRKTPPQRGDVVGVRTTGLSVLYLKRVIALPGETVAIRQGTVWINGQPLDEPYVKARAPWEVAAKTLGLDEYLVIGDNRGMAQEAHTFGVVPRSKIAGRLLRHP